MRKYYVAFFSVCMILLSACSLDEPVYDSTSPESSIRSLDDVDIAMYGIYSFIESAGGGYGRDVLWSTHFFADDLTSTVAWQAGQWGRKSDVNSGNSIANTIWVNFYAAINNANSIPLYIDLVDTTGQQARADRLLAEAKFLRAFAYFHLVQWYGGVPVVTEPSDGTENPYIPRNSVDEVYDLILADLAEAAPLLHTRSSQPSNEFYRATQGAAYGYLAKASLTYADYLYLNGRQGEAEEYFQDAIDAADVVIGSGEYNLVEDYSQLWNVGAERDAYNEVIFAVAHTRDPAEVGLGGEGTQLPVHFLPRSYPNSTQFNQTDPTRGGNGFFKVQPWFFERYNKGDYVDDYRVEATFLTEWIDGSNVTHFAYPLVSADPTAIPESETYIKKYVDNQGIGTWGHENDLFLMRLSEIYLIKAEAENELHGPTTIALNAFNQLRIRARKADGIPRTTPPDVSAGISKEDFRMKIFDERGLEFIGEFHRYFDLIRMIAPDNQSTMYQYQFETFLPGLESGLPSFNTGTGTWGGGVTQASNIVPFDPKYLHFPIPDNQLAINRQMNQNPGW